MSEDDQRRRWLIQRLMCQGEVSPSQYEEKFGEPLAGRIPDLDARLAPFVEDSLLTRKDDGYAVSNLGRLFLRVIAMSFDAYLPEGDSEGPRFSRTV